MTPSNAECKRELAFSDNNSFALSLEYYVDIEVKT